jgi:hypothetical protein
MPTNGILEKQAQTRYGEAPETLIPRLLKERGSPFQVAILLGVYPNTIRWWLSTNGYRYIDGEWVKVGGESGKQ